MGNAKDVLAGLVFVSVGLFFLIAALNYPFGAATRIGPSFFPILLGAMLCAIGVVTALAGLYQPSQSVERLSPRAIAPVCGAVVAFAFLLPRFGLPVAIMVMTMIAAGASCQFRLGSMLLLAAGLAIFCSVVFVMALGLPMPLLGTWLGR